MDNNTKEWVQYGSAIAMLASGIVLTFISFFLYGDVTDNVLMYVGECLVFAGAIYGVSIYVKSKIGEEVNKLIDKLSVKDDDKRSSDSQD